MAFVVSRLALSPLFQRVVGLQRFSLDDRLLEETEAEVASGGHRICRYVRIRIFHCRSKFPRCVDRRERTSRVTQALIAPSRNDFPTPRDSSTIQKRP